MNEFLKNNRESQIKKCKRRLLPAVKRGDIEAVRDGMRELFQTCSKELVADALLEILEDPQYEHLKIKLLMERADNSPKFKRELYGATKALIAEIIENAGLKIEHHFRVTDKGLALTKEALEAIAKTGFPQMHLFGEGWDSVADAGLPRPFIHPLAASINDPQLLGDWVNSYVVASMLVNVANQWVEGDPSEALEKLKRFVFAYDPQVNLDVMLDRSRYDDRELIQLVSIAQSGFHALATKED